MPKVIGLYLSTVRFKVTNEPAYSENSVFIFWHSKMLTGWKLFKGKGYDALVSQSKDGDILYKILKKWGYRVTRGSSSKGGKEALRDLLKSGNSIVMTPDGPRGPAKVIKNGALILSNRTSMPIIPVRIRSTRKKILANSWDRFEIPLPFSTCEITFGDKFYYPEYLNEPALSEFKQRIAEQM